MQNTLHDLFRHMAWADAVIWRAILQAAPPTDDRLHHLLHHIHTVQHAFLPVWNEQPLQLQKAGAFPDSQALARWPEF